MDDASDIRRRRVLGYLATAGSAAALGGTSFEIALAVAAPATPMNCKEPSGLNATDQYRHQKIVRAYNLCAVDGMDMVARHEEWHGTHGGPPIYRPEDPTDPNWAMGENFGKAFLDFHRSMLVGTAAQGVTPAHPGIMDWYYGLGLIPPESTIEKLAPADAGLNYEPDEADFPAYLSQRHSDELFGLNPLLAKLHRNPTIDRTKLSLDPWFTVEGSDSIEPRTGWKKLADFRSVEQLGCCLAGMHVRWHEAIGGAMGDPTFSLFDPLFYFHVHRRIDDIYRNYERAAAAALMLERQPGMQGDAAYRYYRRGTPLRIPITSEGKAIIAADSARIRRFFGEPRVP